MGEPDACTCPAGDSRLYFEAPTYDDAGTTQTEVVLCAVFAESGARHREDAAVPGVWACDVSPAGPEGALMNRRERVLQELVATPGVRTMDLVDRLGLPRRSVTTALHDLRRAGLAHVRVTLMDARSAMNYPGPAPARPAASTRSPG